MEEAMPRENHHEEVAHEKNRLVHSQKVFNHLFLYGAALYYDRSGNRL